MSMSGGTGDVGCRAYSRDDDDGTEGKFRTNRDNHDELMVYDAVRLHRHGIDHSMSEEVDVWRDHIHMGDPKRLEEMDVSSPLLQLMTGRWCKC